MHFASDNAGAVPQQVLDALAAANRGYAASYGGDALTREVQQQLRDLFEAPDAAVHLVATGTAANALGLACISEPWQTIFCSRIAHIHEDECGAPEFFTGGAKLTLVEAPHGKIDPGALSVAIAAEETRGVHGMQRGPVSITQASEAGTVYSLEELRRLCGIAGEFGLPVHLDGARFANALVRLGCSPAEMTWKSGVDVVSFGGTKNGLMGVEAVILFDPAKAREFELRRKRGAHLFSKHRYLAAQMSAYLTDGLWLDLAGRANAACARLVAGLKTAPDVSLSVPADANMVFASWPRETHERLLAESAEYHFWGPDLDHPAKPERLSARLVCDWAASDADTDRFLSCFAR